MRALIQRVSHAEVLIADGTTGTFEVEPPRRIGPGFVVLLAVGQEDTQAEAERLWGKVSKMRIMADENGKTNRSLHDVGGQIMIVSQFTLYADCKKGNRPSFTKAGAPDRACELYRYFFALAQVEFPDAAAGEFGADMRIELENDGPFTIWLDTDEL